MVRNADDWTRKVWREWQELKRAVMQKDRRQQWKLEWKKELRGKGNSLSFSLSQICQFCTLSNIYLMKTLITILALVYLKWSSKCDCVSSPLLFWSLSTHSLVFLGKLVLDTPGREDLHVCTDLWLLEIPFFAILYCLHCNAWERLTNVRKLSLVFLVSLGVF